MGGVLSFFYVLLDDISFVCEVDLRVRVIGLQSSVISAMVYPS